MDEIVLIERKLHGDRKTGLYFQRKSEAETLTQLPGTLQDAKREITMAFQILAGNMGYGNPDLSRVRGASTEGYQEWAERVTRRYKEWASECPYPTKGIVIDHCSFAFSPQEISEQRNTSKRTVYRELRRGFKLYLEINRRS